MTPAEHAALQEAIAGRTLVVFDTSDNEDAPGVTPTDVVNLLTAHEALKADRDRLLAENARLEALLQQDKVFAKALAVGFNELIDANKKLERPEA